MWLRLIGKLPLWSKAGNNKRAAAIPARRWLRHDLCPLTDQRPLLQGLEEKSFDIGLSTLVKPGRGEIHHRMLTLNIIVTGLILPLALLFASFHGDSRNRFRHTEQK
jgi:hypothetical protein